MPGLRHGAGFELQHADAPGGSAGERQVSQADPAAGQSSRTVFRGAVNRASVPANALIFRSLSLSPLQFRAQHVEKIRVSTEQTDFVIRPPAAHPVSIPQIEAGLAIQAEI